MPLPNVPTITVLGKLTFAPDDPPRPLGTYVVQRVKPGLGNIASDPTRTLQIRAHAPRIDKNSNAQQAGRTRVAGAAAGWHALDIDARAYWNERAKPRHITGFNAYVSAWLTGEIGPAISTRQMHGTRRPRTAADPVGHQRGAHAGHGIAPRLYAAAPIIVLPIGWPAHGTRRFRAVDPIATADRGAVPSHASAVWLAASVLPLHPRTVTISAGRVKWHITGVLPDHSAPIMRPHISVYRHVPGAMPAAARGVLPLHGRMKYRPAGALPGHARGAYASHTRPSYQVTATVPAHQRGALTTHGTRYRLRKV